jgi:hypothetical protein
LTVTEVVLVFESLHPVTPVSAEAAMFTVKLPSGQEAVPVVGFWQVIMTLDPEVTAAVVKNSKFERSL